MTSNECERVKETNLNYSRQLDHRLLRSIKLLVLAQMQGSYISGGKEHSDLPEYFVLLDTQVIEAM